MMPAKRLFGRLNLVPALAGMEQRGLAEEDFLGQVRVAGFRSRRGTNSIGTIHVLLPSGVEYVQGNRELRWSNETVARNGSARSILYWRPRRDVRRIAFFAPG